MRPTNSELAIALAFVVGKWKDTGADPTETQAFDDLLARLKDEPAPLAAMQAAENTSCEVPPKRPANRIDMSEKLAVLDAEIDAVNRETN